MPALNAPGAAQLAQQRSADVLALEVVQQYRSKLGNHAVLHAQRSKGAVELVGVGHVADSAGCGLGNTIGLAQQAAQLAQLAQGTGAGQIGVSGSNVTYGGTTIGTVTGGTGTDDLVVSFNGDATPVAVSALVKAIQFSNDQASPANPSRTISFALNDGAAGGQAAPVAVETVHQSPLWQIEHGDFSSIPPIEELPDTIVPSISIIYYSAGWSVGPSVDKQYAYRFAEDSTYAVNWELNDLIELVRNDPDAPGGMASRHIEGDWYIELWYDK